MKELFEMFNKMTPQYNCECACKDSPLRCSKTGDKKRATSFVTLLQNELNSDVARFTTHDKKPCNLICFKTGLNVGGKTRNIAIQLVSQKCCKTSCTFFVARFTVPLVCAIAVVN